MLRNLLLYYFICCFVLVLKVDAQTVVAFQGGEGTLTDNWSFNAITNAGGGLQPGIVPVFPKSGTNAIRAGGGNQANCSSATLGSNCIVGGYANGCAAHGKSIEFNALNVACLDNLQISCFHRNHNICSGNGYDSGENLLFEVRINNGAWVNVGVVSGFGDYNWTYTSSPAGYTAPNTVPNPFVYNVPAGTSTIAFRVRTNSNRSDEVFYIDDVKITTSTTAYNFPGTAGLWNGEINTDWANICNWDTRVLPTSVTNVLIPGTANNDCEILAGTTANCQQLTIDKNRLAIEYNTSALNVYGDLIIDANGLLDMDMAGAEGGILNLRGNWINKRDETFFNEGLGNVNFVGTTNQTITVNGDTKEAFYKLRINKPTGNVIANDDILVDQNNTGGALPMLTLNSGLLDLNSHQLKLQNENFQSLIRTGGGIISEKSDNSSVIIRTMNAITGNYIFPFSKADGTYIPFIFNQTSGNAGDVSAATYGTPANNLPWPVTPVLVSNLISGIGLSPDNRDATVDRFWNIDVTGTSTASLTFSYAPTELPVAPYNDPLTLKAQRYNSSSDLWQPYLPGQSANYYYINVPSVNNFSTWTLTNEISPLPVNLLFFDAIATTPGHVVLKWATASEINNDYFTLQKSKDGKLFKDFQSVKCAGNSSSTLMYGNIDTDPFDGVSYYRLKQTDFDGGYTYSQIVRVEFSTLHTATFSVYPNPTSGNFYISTGENNPSEIYYIKDMNGKILVSIDTENKNLVEINRSNLAKGIYIISNEAGDHTKIILQ